MWPPRIDLFYLLFTIHLAVLIFLALSDFWGHKVFMSSYGIGTRGGHLAKVSVSTSFGCPCQMVGSLSLALNPSGSHFSSCTATYLLFSLYAFLPSPPRALSMSPSQGPLWSLHTDYFSATTSLACCLDSGVLMYFETFPRWRTLLYSSHSISELISSNL